jgi:hypothetical protein
MTLLTYEKYNKTKFAVRGDMKSHHSFVKSLNGRVNKRMKGGEGWLVDIKYGKELEEFVSNQNEEIEDKKGDDMTVFHSENVYENRFDDDSSISTITEESENIVELNTEDESSDESVFKGTDEIQKIERIRKELEKEREEFDRQKREQEKEYETEREKEREEFDRQKREQEKEYETEREKEREEFDRQKEEFERQKREQEKNYDIKKGLESDKINNTEEKIPENFVENENINSEQLQEILEYYRKFSKPNKPKIEKNYIAITKIVSRLNNRLTKLEHKYQKLKEKYSDLKSNKRQ